MGLSQFENRLKRIGIDRYMALLGGAVLLASLLPARGVAAEGLSHVTYWAVSLLFFLYGAKLSTASVWAGFANWRLQLGCLAATFVLMPVLWLVAAPVGGLFLPAALVPGLIFVGAMPSTVQSSIAFTSLARGNVAGAVCAASVSNLLGVLLAPLLLLVLLPRNGALAIEGDAIWRVVGQILVPFFVGQLCRPLLGDVLARHKQATMFVDRGSILLIVYAAFSAGVVAGIWQQMQTGQVIGLIALLAVILAVAMGAMLLMSRALGMGHADRYALFFVGSTKSLATGLPLAGALFAGQNISLLILPLMLFHLMQLMVCSIIAQRQSTRPNLSA